MSKQCLLVSTNYEEGSKEYKSSSKKFQYVIKPVLDELNYECIKADERYQVGLISTKIIKEIILADLVIFDVSDFNPNIFYELAIRNVLKKPVIILKMPHQGLFYEISESQIISIDMEKPEIWHKAKARLATQIIESEKDLVHSSKSIISGFGFSSNLITKEDSQNEFSKMINDLKAEIKKMKSSSEYKEQNSEFLKNKYPPKKLSDESEKKMVIQCKYCNKLFKSRTQLDPEILSNSTNLNRFEKCPHCKQIARYQKNKFLYANLTFQH